MEVKERVGMQEVKGTRRGVVKGTRGSVVKGTRKGVVCHESMPTNCTLMRATPHHTHVHVNEQLSNAICFSNPGGTCS